MDKDLITPGGKKKIDGCSGGGCLRWTGRFFNVTPCKYRQVGEVSKSYDAASIIVFGLRIVLVDKEIGDMYEKLDPIHRPFEPFTNEMKQSVDDIVFARVAKVFGMNFLLAFYEHALSTGRDHGRWDAQEEFRRAIGL